jgi:hypothetical protein
VGEKLVDRGYTAIDSFDTRQQCHAAMADYVGLRLVRQGKIKIEFTCTQESPSSRTRTATG